MRHGRRTSAAARPPILLLAIASLTLTALAAVVPANAQVASERAVSRLAGEDRFGTAVAIATHAFPTGADVVYLARADVAADALAAGALTDGPVLLVPSCAGVPAVVTAALTELAPSRVVALGGPAAVCDATLLEAGGDPDDPTARLAGDDRYATAARIARVAATDDALVVHLASGADGAPDAVAAGTLLEGPIVLTPPNGPLPEATREAIAAIDPELVVGLGGPAALSDAVLAEARGTRGGDRLAGDDRVGTAVAVGERRLAGYGDDTSRLALRVYLARRDDLADAIAGGVLRDGPVLLVPPCGSLPAEVVSFLEDADPFEVVALGGPAAVCEELLGEAEPYTTGVPRKLTADGGTEAVVLEDIPADGPQVEAPSEEGPLLVVVPPGTPPSILVSDVRGPGGEGTTSIGFDVYDEYGRFQGAVRHDAGSELRILAPELPSDPLPARYVLVRDPEVSGDRQPARFEVGVDTYTQVVAPGDGRSVHLEQARIGNGFVVRDEPMAGFDLTTFHFRSTSPGGGQLLIGEPGGRPSRGTPGSPTFEVADAPDVPAYVVSRGTGTRTSWIQPNPFAASRGQTTLFVTPWDRRTDLAVGGDVARVGPELSDIGTMFAVDLTPGDTYRLAITTLEPGFTPRVGIVSATGPIQWSTEGAESVELVAPEGPSWVVVEPFVTGYSIDLAISEA